MDEAGIVAPRGGNGCEVPLSMSATSSSDASPSPINANESNGPSSRRPRRTLGSRMSFKTSLLVLITAGATAAVILHGHRRYPSASIINIKATVSEHLTTLQQNHPALRLPSVQNSPWPQISREFIKGSKAAAASLQTQTLSFTAESAELAWEKSENAYSQLRHLEEEEEENEEVVSTTKENNWIEGIFHLRRGVGGNANNNLRRKEGRNTNVSNNNNKQHYRQQQRNTNKENNHRRTTMKANNDHHDEHSNAAATTTTNGQEKGGLLIMEFISKSPMAASLLAFCTLLFLGGSFIVSSSSNHSEMLFRRNSLLLDENEAEIVEFYEKEMEGGMLSQQHPSVPLFDHHDHHHLLSDHDDNEGGGGTITHHPAPILKRASTGGSTDIRLMKNSPERNQSDSCLSRTATRLSYNHHHHVRSSSDSALSRHLLFIGGESSSTLLKGSKCDLYYSRVLQDIETLDYEDDVVEDLQVDNDVAEAEGGEAMIRNGREDAMELGDQECQFTLMENLSSLSEEKDDADADRIVKGDGTEDVQTSTAAPPATPSHPQTTVSGEGEDDTCFESAHSEEREDSRPQSPQSQSSSISSLTSEGYDIESPFRGSSKEEKEEVPNNNKVTNNNEGKSSTPLYGTTAIVMPSSPQPQEPIPKDQSCGATTPPTSNLHKRQGDTTRQYSRRVSFSPEVRIREIPRAQPRRNNELSSERYLYIMLFSVAIAIAVFSLVPAHPSLSPHSLTGGEILQRAESMLSSQWDVEL